MLFVYLGVRVYRDRGGIIRFGEAFKVGGLIALICCLFYVVSWLLVYELIIPDFLERYTQLHQLFRLTQVISMAGHIRWIK